MSPTNAMMLELSLVMSASHTIWGTVDEGPPPPPPTVPDVFITMTGAVDNEGAFDFYSPFPENTAEDLALVADYPGDVEFISWDNDGDTIGESTGQVSLLCHWVEELHRWEYHITPS